MTGEDDIARFDSRRYSSCQQKYIIIHKTNKKSFKSLSFASYQLLEGISGSREIM